MAAVVSPDGHRVAALIDGKLMAIDVASGTIEPLPPIAAGNIPFAWSHDGRALFVERRNVAAIVSKYDLATGAITAWRTLLPGDRAGVMSVTNIRIAADERSYAYTYHRRLSELFLVTGLK